MTNFDVGVGITDSLANQFCTTIYSGLHDQVFKGQETVSGPAGMDITISWDIQEAPSLSFSPINKDEAVKKVKEAISEKDEINEKFKSNKEAYINSVVDALVTSCFSLNLSKVYIKASTIEGIMEWDATCKLDVLVQLESDNGNLKVNPLKCNATGIQGEKMWFVNKVVLPAALSIVRKMIPAIQIPSIELPHVSLTPPLPLITQGKATAICNRTTLGIPAPVTDYSWPDSPFFLMLKPHFIAETINNALTGFTKEFGLPSDELFLVIGTLKYAANATVSNITVKPGSNPTELDFSAILSGHVRGGVQPVIPFMPTIGVNYAIVSPDKIKGRIGVKIEGNMVKVTTIEITPIIINLIPIGGIVEWVISAATAPLLNVVTMGLVPLITTFFNGLTYDIVEIPSASLPIMGQVIEIKPDGLTLAPHADMTAVKGNILFREHSNVTKHSEAVV